MNAREPEPRTAVMIMVEASWADQNGTLHKCSARMENTSRSGARIRLRKAIAAGTKIQVQWRWEQFTGETRYCRGEGKDYVVEIQKGPKPRTWATAAAAKSALAEPLSRRQGVSELVRAQSETQSQTDSPTVEAGPRGPVSVPARLPSSQALWLRRSSKRPRWHRL